MCFSLPWEIIVVCRLLLFAVLSSCQNDRDCLTLPTVSTVVMLDSNSKHVQDHLTSPSHP